MTTQVAGLKEGEYILAVGGMACLSHPHCVHLLNTAPTPLDLIVCTPTELREPVRNNEPVEIG
jgi:hypothetical protein